MTRTRWRIECPQNCITFVEFGIKTSDPPWLETPGQCGACGGDLQLLRVLDKEAT